MRTPRRKRVPFAWRLITHRKRRILWNTGTVLLILALGMQYIYVSRNELAQTADTRPWVERYCKLVGCELPLRRDVQSIELLQREITQDLERDDVLHVRAMFVNHAGFTQSWPIVQITLSDTSNQVIVIATSVGFSNHGLYIYTTAS